MCYNNCNGFCMASPTCGQCPFDEEEQLDCELYEAESDDN